SNLIEYQKMFDASARMIRTSDEMLDTVLNLKPM
ncbi:MAG: flagellar basal body rod C-terminal domain-containing protein, partial [Bdellovibrionota bacterium]